MPTIRLMESSNNYNNHFVTIIADDGEVLFDECLIKFNNTPLSFKLRDLVSNKTTTSIPHLDVYGYTGTISDISIIPALLSFTVYDCQD